VSATVESGQKITYLGANIPRGASVNANTGVVTWKPDASQIGENHFAITAYDETGREATKSFVVTVYGSTTSSPSQDNTSTDTPSTDDGATTPDDGSGTTDDGSASGTASGDVRFIDLGAHAWAADSINSLADDGIVKGTTYNTYSPANNITRADYALLLVRAFGMTSDDTANFADVLDTDYFAAELAIARNTGIVNGIGDNKYAPRNTITRQDMMVIIYRALEKLGKLGNTDATIDASAYPDYADVADYAKDAVNYLIANGLVNGKNGRIAPTDYTTRAEVAVLIKRILDYVNQ
ncbi:MAG: S-layer homology domain-containing protein, partial [Oscillospiraceae bacterium]|nr:S-layer homology domain-containing protein [Oscillospiraceae bacterium]